MSKEKIKIREIVRPTGTTYKIYVNLDCCKPSFLSKVNNVEKNIGWANVYVKHTESLGDAVFNFCPFVEPTIYKTLDDAKKDLEIIKKRILKEEIISNKVVYSE